MIYILMAVVALLAIAYIVYLVLDLMSRRKFAEQYSTWEPDLDSYYRQELEREQQAKDEKICEMMENLLRMQGMI
ncbi:hypothetical protein [Collinsella sp. AF38-3AC]|uniref:hypothetical protein n=1 Tax=Collinsella sp. AF38-3AC TaxID=2292015 RepID=UPI000E4D9904|nr:hypothetical protein [Collinsella sp. AF38-3AC]RHL21275.1 hypothetical protein DW029_10625 [Collinsella sp. AF38-3AC]